MVRRIFKYGLLAVLALVATILGFAFWMVWSEGGSARLINALFHWSPIQLSAQRINGRLADVLALENLRIHWPEGTIEVKRIRLDWSFGQLLGGQLKMSELVIEGVDIMLDAHPRTTSETNESLAFDQLRIPHWPMWFWAEIASLKVERLSVRTPDATLWKLDTFHNRVRLTGGVLSLSEIDLISSVGRLSGKLDADLIKPRLSGALRVSLAEPIVDVNQITLVFDLDTQNEALMTVGRIDAQLWKGRPHWLDASARIALIGSTLHLDQGLITFPGHSDRLTIDGSAQLIKGLPWKVTVEVDSLDLEEFASVPLRVYGQAWGEGDLDAYRGQADLQNRVEGWSRASLTGDFSGDWDQIRFPALGGEWLGGWVSGELFIGWLDDFSLRGFAKGRDLNPATLFPEWPGRVNLDLHAELFQPGGDPLTMRFFGDLPDSTLYGKALTGGFDIRIQDDQLDIARLSLHGAGIALTASGNLTQRLDFSANAQRLTDFLPGLSGQGSAKGWLRRDEKGLVGDLALNGRDVGYAGFTVAGLSLTARKSEAENISIQGESRGATAGGQRIDALSLILTGDIEDHRGALDASWMGGKGHLAVSGGLLDGIWTGQLTELRLMETALGIWELSQPARVRFAAQSMELEPLGLRSRQGETINLDATLTTIPLAGTARLQWDALQLHYADPWLDGGSALGATSGNVRLQLEAGDLQDLSVTSKLTGRLEKDGQRLDVRDIHLTVDWNGSGLTGKFKADLGDMGTLKAQVRSSEPARWSLPSAGEFSAHLSGLPLDRIPSRWLGALEVAGTIKADMDGGWKNRYEIEFRGKTNVNDGHLHWATDEGSLSTSLQQAEAKWRWQGESLTGSFGLTLGRHGRLRGEFQLPLPARWPIIMVPGGDMRGTLTGHIQEKGLLSALFPGILRETAGQLAFDWTLGGSWVRPDLKGTFGLTGATAYLPFAGIELKDIGFRGRLTEDRIFLDTFSVSSGSGRLHGTGEAQLAEWLPKDFQLKFTGKSFQVVNLPELELVVDPDVQLSGSHRKVKLRGKLVVSEALVAPRDTLSTVRSSSDLILVDAEAKPHSKTLPFELDFQTRIIIGDRVLVKTRGIDARLGGEVELQASSLDNLTGKGNIRVVKGSYTAYGLGLNIERGNVVFAGGSVSRPLLDILALRKIGEVKAGVTVTGTPRQPLVKLYSDPLMPDTDILSYIVLGRPLGSDSGQSDLLMTAAGALLSKGESVVLQDRLKRRLGLDVLEVKAGEGDVSDSVVTVGKYLSPKVFISFGHALFTGANEVRMRYSLTDHWEFESNVGSESGADLYYRIEFE